MRRKRHPKQVLVLGLDGAGKITYMNSIAKSSKGEVVSAEPSKDFHTETLTCRHYTFISWDVGGDQKNRPFWRHYFATTCGLVFIVDGSCRDGWRVEEERRELWKLLGEDELSEAPLLVVVNEKDADVPRTLEEVVTGLGLSRDLSVDRKWYILGCCALSGEGVFEGLDLLDQALGSG